MAMNKQTAFKALAEIRGSFDEAIYSDVKAMVFFFSSIALPLPWTGTRLAYQFNPYAW